jgi:hypothetical protein
MSPFKNDPIIWAKALVTAQSIEGAHRIANTYRQPRLGKDGQSDNPLAPWYERAYQWLVENHPLPVTD